MNMIFENAALMGLFGVFIGSLLSFVGVMYSEHIKLKTLKKEQEYMRKKDVIENKQRIYNNFLHLINHCQQTLQATFFNFKNFATDEEKVTLIKDLSAALSELDLFAPREISSACHKLRNNVINLTLGNEEFQSQYNTIIKLFQEDLLIESSSKSV